MDLLVSTAWLADNLSARDLRVVDATLFLDPSRDPRAEFEAGHIPGAVFIALAELVDDRAAIENTVPPPAKFASRMQALGIGDGDRIVLYDNSPLASATRLWFLLRHYGVSDVAVLDGGLAKWRSEGREVETGPADPRHRHFTIQPGDMALRTKHDLLANLDTGAEQVIDARSAARFTGEGPESRPELASGHIPGSRNLPYPTLFNSDGTWKRPDELRRLITEAGIDLARPLVTTCGSGMTACAAAFALHLTGKTDVALYDGSWAEWGADPATPKATGSA